MKQKVSVSSSIPRSARVAQIESMFDVPPRKKAARSWEVELPIDDGDWNVGLIVGPSGSGKSTIARNLFGERMRDYDWDPRKAVVDNFPAEMPIKEVVGLLTSVGFSTPPSWLQPFPTLSNGEQFRATLARAIAETAEGDFAVIDEFTSTVDRQVAKVASHAVAKAVRRRKGKLVLLSCHYDIVDWLAPDWIYQVDLAKFTRGCLRQRPALTLEIHKVDRACWSLFREHHYLSTDLHVAAQCFGGYIDGQLVAFGSYLNFPGTKRPSKKGHRFVCLPDWQGLGIISAMDDWLGERLWAEGFEWRATLMHQGLVRAKLRSPRWRLVKAPSAREQISTRNVPRRADAGLMARNANPRMLGAYSFVYVPKPAATG